MNFLERKGLDSIRAALESACVPAGDGWYQTRHPNNESYVGELLFDWLIAELHVVELPFYLSISEDGERFRFVDYEGES